MHREFAGSRHRMGCEACGEMLVTCGTPTPCEFHATACLLCSEATATIEQPECSHCHGVAMVCSTECGAALGYKCSLCGW